MTAIAVSSAMTTVLDEGRSVRRAYTFAEEVIEKVYEMFLTTRGTKVHKVKNAISVSTWTAIDILPDMLAMKKLCAAIVYGEQ